MWSLVRLILIQWWLQGILVVTGRYREMTAAETGFQTEKINEDH